MRVVMDAAHEASTIEAALHRRHRRVCNRLRGTKTTSLKKNCTTNVALCVSGNGTRYALHAVLLLGVRHEAAYLIAS